MHWQRHWMLDEDGAVAVVEEDGSVVVAVVAMGFHSPLPFLCCKLKIDVDLCVRTYRYVPSLYCLLVLWYVGTKYHHSLMLKLILNVKRYFIC